MAVNSAKSYCHTNRRQKYGVSSPKPYCHKFVSYFRVHSACVWPTALKLASIANFGMHFLVMGFISLVDEI